MERERPLVLCVVVLCCSAECCLSGAPLVLCVVVLCCSAESSVGVSVNGGADGAGETPCIMCCCFVLLCRVFC